MDHLEKESLIRSIEVIYLSKSLPQDRAIKQVAMFLDKMIDEERKKCRNVCKSVASDYRNSPEQDNITEDTIRAREAAAKVADICAYRIRMED